MEKGQEMVPFRVEPGRKGRNGPRTESDGECFQQKYIAESSVQNEVCTTGCFQYEEKSNE
jgi:hypothetical protein